MKTGRLSKISAVLLVVFILAALFSISTAAASIEYDESNGGSDYYQVISKRDWDIAPGVAEAEIVLNNDAGTRRQVVHTITVDINNPYTKVISGYKGMWPEEGNYGTESTSTQALNAEKLGYGNVVAATNVCLNWYTDAYYKANPHLIGEPIGYTILDGEYYENSQGPTWGAQNCIVINYDKHPITGEERPSDMKKVWMRSTSDPLTGWEEQVIPVQFAWLVKPDPVTGEPVNQYKTENYAGGTSRTFVGVKEDGTLVVAVSDGEQAPYSSGFTEYEMADYMIKMGCVIAANCDGGGSTTFCTERPGEDLKVNCSLSDGGERPTTNTLLVISTAPADGVFARATIDTDYDYYTPGSTVEFSAIGTDAVGTKVDIPSDAEWVVKEDNMGTIAGGVFTSNGTEGTVTVQMIYEGEVVGERSITIAIPDEISFEQPIVTIPFGKTAIIPVKATTGNGLFEIGLGANDITFTTTNSELGRFDGLNFIAVDEADAPADVTSTVTATLNMGTNPTATVQLILGKGSEVLWDFEGGQADIDEWNVINNRTNATHWDYDLKLSLADKSNGQVHDGNYSMRLETNGLSSKDSHSEQYAWIRLGVDGEAVVLENARSVGFWLYVPEDNIQCWVQGHYMFDSNGDGTLDTLATVTMMESENVYYNIDESGWHYLSMDVSNYEKIALKYSSPFDKDPSDGMTGETGEFFLSIIFHKAINNKLWQDNGSINGPYTYYLDNFTVDYSEAVDDRENPVFDKIYLDGETALVKRDVITTTNNILNFSAAVEDATVRVDATGTEHPLYNTSGLDPASAKVYIDGVEVSSEFTDGVLSANNISVSDGYHRVKFEICDKAGNKSVVIRVVKVESGTEASTINVIPDDASLDRILFGSIYWMNLEATAIETIQSVSTVIDLNNVNHWELDHMILAEGFTAEYTINAETNTASITITRTGENTQIGTAVLAQLPVRILYFDTDIQIPGYTAETYWTKYPFWAQDMKMDVDMGLITHTDGHTSTFSNEEFHVDTEMYTSMANMDKAYFTSHGTTHVHIPVALEDKAPSCTEEGYTGRTFCEVCNSVVDWGTSIPATGHVYEIVDGKLVCHCGKESTATGLQSIGGKNYYAVNGKLISGWQMIDDEWYCFDETTFAGLEGEQYTEDAIKFSFDNGRVISGAWARNSGGLRYWYGPGYYRDTSPDENSAKPYEIDGKTYLFNRQGYMQTGVAYFFTGVYDGVIGEVLYYDCGNDGVAELLTGVYNDYFYINGVRQDKYQLVEYNGDYYFIDDGNKLAKSIRLYLSEQFVEGHTYADGTPIQPGYYDFDSDGKMIMLNGVVGDYLYINGVRQDRYQLVEYNGDYYFINDGNKLAKNITLYLKEEFVTGHFYPDGESIQPGYYDFDADGKMIILNGPVGDYFYINGIRQDRYQLVEYNGDYYFINDGNKLAKSIKLYLSEQFVEGHTYADGTPIQPGYYDFDSDGKMIILNGVVGDYLYINGVRQDRYQLVEYNGDYYFINDGNKLAKNITLYLKEEFVTGHFYPNGESIQPGYCDFDADGKMIVLNGPVGDYFYVNGVRQDRYQLVEYNGDYYFINDGNKLAKNITLYLDKRFVQGKTFIDGSLISVGYYTFDADGKMVFN